MHTVRCSDGLPELLETCVALVDARSRRRHQPVHLPSPTPAQRSDEAPQGWWTDEWDVTGGHADAGVVGDGAARSVPSEDVGGHTVAK